jgi:hypothetical protein
MACFSQILLLKISKKKKKELVFGELYIIIAVSGMNLDFWMPISI